MLTPVDIENKEFTKAFRGYDIYEVEEFMKILIADYEKLYRENSDLREKNAIQSDAIANYKGMEETMQNAILVAQRTAEDIKQNAYERSETIIKDAERRASEAVNQANRAISNLEKTYLNMQREMNGFKAKMSALLSTYMQLLSDMPEKKTPAYEVEPVPEVEEPKPAPETTRTAEVPSAPAPAEPEAPAEEDTNTFTLPTAIPREEPKPEPTPIQKPITGSVGFEPSRKLNPVVEELLRKKREEQKRAEQAAAQAPAAPVVDPEPPVPAAEVFSVTRETIQKEPITTISEINLEELESFDIFKDDSL
ncbi:MAG: DivIVA domain-containing protein [Ruminococcaceae bacterium]|nr:DivIVA domain-containing protein [Oscillospiraceae bacterium]